MPEQLFERLNELRQRVRFVLWVYGLCCLVVTFFLSSLLAGSLDWLWHLDESGTRVLLLLGILGASAWVGWRFLWIPVTTDFSDVELASRIERQNPTLKDNLSSTVEFLKSGQDERTGSPALQRQVIESTLRRLDEVSVEGLIETRPVQRVGWWAVGTCLLVGFVVGLNQAEAATAMNRLLFPFSSIPWPRDVELRFVNEDLNPLEAGSEGALTVVQGETLEIFVENTRGPLPADLALIHRRADGKIVRETMRQSSLWDDDGQAREIGGATLHVTNGPLFFWARGGDGETLPLQVDVVPPPRIETLHVRVTPPDYTGQPEKALPENVGHVEGLVGTKVDIQARINKPLEAAILHRKDASLQRLKVSSDGLEISGTFQLDRPGIGSWWIALTDRQGFENPEAPRYDLRSIADSAPSVTIENPETDLLVTPTARVPFQVLIRDDLGIRSARLAFQSSRTGSSSSGRSSNGDDAPNAGLVDEPILELTKRPATSSTEPPSDSDNPAGQRDSGHLPLYDADVQAADAEEQLRPELVWDLADHDWKPGTRVEVVAEAFDWYDLGDEHIGRSNRRILTIVTSEEKRSELADRQAALLLDLERATKTQETARELLNELKVQVTEAGKLRPEDLDLLKRVELDQRQIQSRLTEDSDSLERQARSIRQERQDNNVSDADSNELLDALTGELEYLRTGPFTEIEQKLTETRKLSTSKQRPDSKQKRRLQSAISDATESQKDAIRSLRGLLEDLSQWRNKRNLNADMRTMTGEQNELSQDSGELGQNTLTRSLAELTAQERADLARLAARQQQMADRVEKFANELKDAIEAAKETQPDAARAFEEALGTLTEAALTGEMRQAAMNLQQNRVGDAVQAQQQILDTMRKVQDQLDQREATDTESLIKQLDEARQDLAAASTLQDMLMKRLDEAAGLQDPTERELQLETLRREEQHLRQAMNDTLRRLQRLESPSADAAGRAAQRMQNAEQALADGNANQAKDEMQEALDDLEQAERELAEDQKQAEVQLAREQLEKLAGQLESLLARQNAAISETQRLQLELEASGKWSRARLKSLRNLTDVQKNLEQETSAAAEKVSSIEIVSLGLKGAAGYMIRAIASLDDRNTGPRTIGLQKRAARRFADLLAALQEDDEQSGEQPQNQDQPQNESQQSGPEGDIVTLIAQLKVIRSLQVDLQERIVEIRNRSPEDGELSPEDIDELQQIAGEQDQIADLVRELTSWFGDPELEPDAGSNESL